jgi:hypothetical protein
MCSVSSPSTAVGSSGARTSDGRCALESGERRGGSRHTAGGSDEGEGYLQWQAGLCCVCDAH